MMDTNTLKGDFAVLKPNAADVVASVHIPNRRILLFGPPGAGKSILATQIAIDLAQVGQSCCCLSADPGSPLLGVPGAISLGRWKEGGWQVEKFSALCSLDAGRFRLPVVSIIQELLRGNFKGGLLIDGPGVVRGVAGRELLEGLVEATQAEVVLVVTPTPSSPPLMAELSNLAVEVFVISAPPEAMRPGKRVRARRRTKQWNRYLADGISRDIDIDSFNVIGTPPPRGEDFAWTGRQIALMRSGQTLTMGEVQQLEGSALTVTLADEVSDADTLLIRDAQRSTGGLIETATPFAAERCDYFPPADVLPSVDTNNGPRLVGRVGTVDVALINGVFGDPLLHLRLRHLKRSQLFARTDKHQFGRQ